MDFKKIFFIVVIATALLLQANICYSQQLPQKKITKAGLYVTAKEAYQKWKKDASIKIVDIRTPEEYLYVGHPVMAYSIPAFFMKDRWYVEKGSRLIKNDNFTNTIKRLFKKGDKIFLICRSGGRSAYAANLLHGEGYQRVYSITDGFEGDKIKVKGDPHEGHRKKNGWKNSDLPWTFKIKKELLYYTD